MAASGQPPGGQHLTVLLPVFALSIFVSAALLFMVQPLAGRILLPLLGGSPAVWNTCMLFFQAMLLAGYGYSHLSTTRLRPRAQAIVHVVLLALAAATLPIPISVGQPPAGEPIRWLLLTLLVTVGLPFFVVSTTGPLLQRWFSTTDHVKAKDPYFLYAASNAGSMVGLIAYPAILEPLFGRAQQSLVWTSLFGVLFALVVTSAVMMLRRQQAAPADVASESAVPAGQALSTRTRLHWLLLAFTPSSMMLGLTQYLTTDVAPIPLLWIVPLLLYLLTFIIAFSNRISITSGTWGRMMPVCLVGVMIAMLTAANNPMWLLAAIHLGFFFVTTMMCHKRMAETRPDASRLTEFYFIMSLGGVLGGVFNALLSPVFFDRLMEYPLVIGLACFLRPQVFSEQTKGRPGTTAGRWAIAALCGLALLALVLNIDAALLSGWLKDRAVLGSLKFDAKGGLTLNGTLIASVITVVAVLRAGVPVALCCMLVFRRGSMRFAAGAMALLVGSTLIGDGGMVVRRARTFFGINTVTVMPERIFVKLSHGTTVHGLQARNFDFGSQSIMPPPQLSGVERAQLLFATRRTSEWRMENLPSLPLIPTTYYHTSGPIGEIFGMLIAEKRLNRTALIGLGAGTLAAYAMPGSRFTFYEIDPAVIEIASPSPLGYRESYFTYIADAARDKDVQIGYEEGDGRLLLKSTVEGPFELIVLDAFSSDAIPVHLLTKEAIEVYLDKLTPTGLIAFHISNRYFDLRDPLNRIATELKLRHWVRNDSVVTSDQLAEGKKESLWLVMARTPQAMGGLGNLPNWERPLPNQTFPLWTDDHANVLGALISRD